MKHPKRFLRTISIIVLLLTLSSVTFAESDPPDPADDVVTEAKSPLATGLIAIAAALAVGLCALATGYAQSRIGAAGCGTLAEKPENSGTIILLVAIPETMVILGFVIAVVMMFTQ